MEKQTTWAIRLKMIMDYFGLTQEAFANLLGISRQSVINILKEKHAPQGSTLHRIEQFVVNEINRKSKDVKFNLHWLYSGEGDMLVSAKEKLIELYQDYELLELPMIDASAVAGYSDNIGQNLNKDVTNKKYPIIKMSNINYTNASILLIQGLSMYPTLKDGELVIVTPIPINRASGICAVSIRGSDAASGMFTVKRVIKNRDNVLTLSADRDKEEIDVQYSDILAIWQIGDTVFAPRRD